MANFIPKLIKFIFGLKKINDIDTKNIKNVLVIRQHNQFGDLLASSSLFVALKESLNNCKVNVVVAKQNYYAITKNKYVDSYFIFDKKKLFNIFYFIKLFKFLRKNYDLCIVPSTVAISTTSTLLGRISDAKIKIGVSELDGKVNKYDFLYNYSVKLDWRKNPDRHVADFGLDVVRLLGITTDKFNPVISFDEEDLRVAKEFIKEMDIKQGERLIGFHVGAGKPKNRWSLNKYITLIDLLHNNYKIKIYFTGSSADKEELDYIDKKINLPHWFYVNKTIPQLAALISLSDLFITNDTGVMHVAGSTNTPQISIFGPTNPFNWAPVGANKFYVRDKSELIDDIEVETIFNISKKILGENE